MRFGMGSPWSMRTRVQGILRASRYSLSRPGFIQSSWRTMRIGVIGDRCGGAFAKAAGSRLETGARRLPRRIFLALLGDGRVAAPRRLVQIERIEIVVERRGDGEIAVGPTVGRFETVIQDP